jgi:hypothetical protein
MKKLVLDDLDLKSFEIAAPEMGACGTVDAHMDPITDVVDWVLSCLICP